MNIIYIDYIKSEEYKLKIKELKGILSETPMPMSMRPAFFCLFSFMTLSSILE